MDETTFVRLVRDFQTGWYRYAMMLTSDEEFSKDCLQDVMEILWRKQNALNEIKNLNGYGFIILRNKCFEHLKSSKLRVVLEEEKINREAEEEHSLKGDAEKQFRIIKSLVKLLPTKQKEIFILKDLEGLSFEEIEKITGIKYQNLRANLSLARKRLKEEFQNIA